MSKQLIKYVLVLVSTLALNGCVHRISCEEYDFDLGRKIVFERTVKRLKEEAVLINYDDRLEVVIETEKLFKPNTVNWKKSSDQIIADLIELSKHYSHVVTMVRACARADLLAQGLIEAQVREMGAKLKRKGLDAYVVVTGTEKGFCTEQADQRIKVLFKKRKKVDACPGGKDYCYTGQKVLICR